MGNVKLGHRVNCLAQMKIQEVSTPWRDEILKVLEIIGIGLAAEVLEVGRSTSETKAQIWSSSKVKDEVEV